MDRLPTNGINPTLEIPPPSKPNPLYAIFHKRKLTAEPNESQYAAILVSPALILIFMLVAIPMLFAFYLSVNKVDIVEGEFKLIFSGVENFIWLFNDPRFVPTIGRTLYFAVLRLTISISIGLSLALLLNEATLAARILNRLFLIPWALSFVVNGLMWKWMYSGDYGIINYFLLQLGLIDQYKSWLGSTATALNAMTIADAWKAIPFVALVLLAGLKSIAVELYEAAKVDGAGIFQRFWHITLPGLRPVLLVTLVLQTIWSILAFASIWPVTQGGPADSTMLLNIYAYQQSFIYMNFGYGSALAYIVTAIIVMMTVAYLTVIRMEN